MSSSAILDPVEVAGPVDSDVVIRAENLSKCYQIYEKPQHRLFQGLFRGRKQFFREFWALKDVSFEVRKGETVGIIGRNGSGKSTLLQMICGTLTPTAGTVEVKGRVGALLELGAGFNPEFTGRENVYMNASVLGLTHEEVDARYEEIVAFADIGQFIDQPLKTYSSGMYVRLAFGVIANVTADVLVIDEALAVGDAVFTQKCMRFLRRFQESGTILFVSHDTGAVLNLCRRALWLQQGTATQSGDAKQVVEAYVRANIEETQRDIGVTECTRVDLDATTPLEADRRGIDEAESDEGFRFDATAHSFGRGGALIEAVVLVGENGEQRLAVTGGEAITLRITVSALQDIRSAIVGFSFKDRLGQIVFGENTFLSTRAAPVELGEGDLAVAEFRFRVPHLRTGEYTLDVAIAEGTQDQHVQHQWFFDAVVVHVHTERPVWGLMAVPCRVVKLAKHRLHSDRDDADRAAVGSTDNEVGRIASRGGC
jgi:lipopolysaccharide transport system ATP-binding protein